MELEQIVSEFKQLQKTLQAYNHALGVMSVDGETVAPRGSYAKRGETFGILVQAHLDLYFSEKTENLLKELEAHKDSLDPITRKEYEHFAKNYEKEKKVPVEEQVAFSMLVNDASAAWRKAKEENQFELFCPYLEKLIDSIKKQAAFYDDKKEPYDVWLDSFEPGMNMEKADAFFDAIRTPLVELVKKVGESKVVIDDAFLHRHYPRARQMEFSSYLMDVLKINPEFCVLGETEHPFTSGFNKEDVRITTHYYENDLSCSMYSVLHEGGHAIFELGIGDEYADGCLGGGTSSGVHESQSRFFENLVGRSERFIEAIFPKIQEFFPEQLNDVTAKQFYLAVNKSEPSLIRTEADELTYCLHIMVRYELEKKLMTGEILVKDLPEQWNRLYKEYLGVDVPNDSKGVLQDVHWANGLFGYFPTYALGSAYGAQFIHKMRETMDVDACLAAGDVGPLKDWLGEKIHQYGWFLDPKDVMVKTTGEEFNPQYYIDYLTKKYTKIYEL